MTPITLGDSFASFEREVEAFPAPQDERRDLIAKVKELLKEVSKH